MPRRLIFACLSLTVFLAVFQVPHAVVAHDLMLQREHNEQHLETMLQQLYDKQAQGSLSEEERALLETSAARERIRLRLLHAQQQAERTLDELGRREPPAGALPPPVDLPRQQAHQLEQRQQQLQFRIQRQLDGPKPGSREPSGRARW